jgi:hypothetical protein
MGILQVDVVAGDDVDASDFTESYLRFFRC